MREAAERYARALFELTQDETSLCACVEAMTDTPALFEALCSPCISKSEKHALTAKILAGMDRLFIHFFQMLCDNGRIAESRDILTEFHALALKRENSADLYITCAFPPNEKELERLQTAMCEKNHWDHVIPHIRQDSALLGGFVLEAGGTVYDQSVRGALRNLRKNL